MRLPRGLAAAGLPLLYAAAVFTLAPAPRPVRAASRASRTAGEALFHKEGCEHCHGPALLGTERGPALTGVGRKLHPDAIHHQILAGGDGMPAFENILAPDEVTDLVAFLSAQKKRGLPPSKAPATPVPKLPANGSDDQS